MMKKLFSLLAVVLCLTACEKAPKLSKLTINTDDNSVVYNVETAATLAELEKGLMDRETLAADSGMIFDLSNVPNKVTAMWMKDTKLPLDMLFVSHEGFIYWMKENAQPYSEEYIVAPFPAAAVVELNAGEIKKHNIKVGHQIKHKLFKPVQDAPVATNK